MTIRAVIFDLGHTLWDIQRQPGTLERAYATMRATLCERLDRDDLPAAETIMRAVGEALRDTYYDTVVREIDAGDTTALQQPGTHTWVDKGCRAIGMELEQGLLLEVTPPLFATEIEALVCSPGTREGLEALAALGFRLGCVTNTLADAPAIRAMLRRHEFEDLMESVVVSADEGWRKPHASLFEKALRELSVASFEAVFVGDSPLHDIRGAKLAGMRAVLTRQYVARPHERVQPQADAIIDHVRELPAVISLLDAQAPTTGADRATR